MEEEASTQKTGNRRKLIILASVLGVALLLCCCGLFVWSDAWSDTPEGQVAMTRAMGERNAARETQTSIAAVIETEEAIPTETAVPTKTLQPTKPPSPSPTQPPPSTNTPQPTVTTAPIPINTPLPTETPTPIHTLSPEDMVLASVENALGDGNRSVQRVGKAELLLDEVVIIEWAIDDNLSTNMIRGGTQLDIVEILKAIDAVGVDYERIELTGTFSLTDVYGNSSESPVVWATYSRETVEKINWDNFLFKDVYVIADSYKFHPAFTAE